MAWLIKILSNPQLPQAQPIGFSICKFIFLLGLLYAAINKVYYFEDYLYVLNFLKVKPDNFLLETIVPIIQSKKNYLVIFEYAYIVTILINILLLKHVWASFAMLIFQILNMAVFSPNNMSSENAAHYFLILFFFTDLSRLHKSLRFRALHFLIGIRAIQIQMTLMYFFSGFSKLLNPAWFSGVALSYIFKLDYISKYDLQIFDKSLLLNNISTYSVLIFECFFFIILTSQRLRPFLVIFGISMHILIGALLGHLWDISIITISLYALYIDWRKLFQKLEYF